jgi:hypothetical protein
VTITCPVQAFTILNYGQVTKAHRAIEVNGDGEDDPILKDIGRGRPKCRDWHRRPIQHPRLPDGDTLRGLMIDWYAAVDSALTTVRRAIDAAKSDQPNLLDAMRELPVGEPDELNPSKLGWRHKRNPKQRAGRLGGC